MPAFFPALQEEELLYSAIARYASMVGYIKGAAVVRDCFTAKLHTISACLPQRIQTFVDSLPPGHPYSVNAIIEKHTTLPYYVPFISVNRAERATAAMQSGVGTATNIVLGARRAFAVNPEYLAYCDACVEQDRALTGASYWRRVHQLPGVLVCPRHSVPLRRVPNLRPGFTGRTMPVPLNTVLGSGTRFELPRHVSHSTIQDIATDTQWLLDHGREVIGCRRLSSQYLAHLQARGFTKGRSILRTGELQMAFSDFWSLELLEGLACQLIEHGTFWVAAIAHGRRLTTTPLRHILLARFLGQSMQSLLAPEWCRETDSAENPLVGSPEQLRGRNGESIFHQREWELKLRTLVEDHGISLRSIAQKLGTERITVKRHAIRLGIARPEWRPVFIASAHQHERRRAKHRAAWLSLQQRFPEATRSELRERAPATMQWLRKNDDDWLQANSPHPLPRGRQAGPQIDWTARDADLCERVRDAIESLHSRGKQITVHAIKTEVGRLGGWNWPLIPKTAALFNSATESTAEARSRRLIQAVTEFREEGFAPTVAELKRRARLTNAHDMREEITRAAEELREELCTNRQVLTHE